MSWNRIARVGAALLVSASVATPAIYAYVPQPDAQQVRVGGDIKEPKKIKDAKPVYPPLAQTAKISGIVIIEAIIGKDGSIRDAKILRGMPMLNDAALEAVRQWRYTPTTLNGVPVEVVMTVTVNFTLNEPQ